MKIRQLHINRFGHFNECDLTFSGDGIQLIYGPNEAGKTTLLEFLRGLLFDFPVRTPYDFGGQGEMAGVATLELRDGRVVELRRRKGNKDKVTIKLNGQSTDLDNIGWLRMLDHADRSLFESVFAFGLDQLSQGEASLKHESLQSALFGGGLGGTNSPDKVVTDLSRQADELFKKGGSKPTVNAILADLKRLSKEIRDRSLRPAKYHEAEATLSRAADHAQALHKHVGQLRQKHSKVEKQVRAWQKWWELQQRHIERATLSVPNNIPPDARQQYLDVSKELKSLTVERTRLEEDVKQTTQSLTALNLDPSSISYRAEIKSCITLRQSFIEAKEQLPERQRQREAVQLLIDRELAELRPGWRHDDLRSFSVDVATRTEIERLTTDHRERTTEHLKLLAKRDGDAANLERAREDLAEIGSLQDVSDLATVLADEADFIAHRKHSENIRDELSKLERTLAAQCRKLTPPLAAASSDPHELPVPRVETVSDFETRFADFRDEVRTISASIEEDEAEQRTIEESLTATISSDAIPSLDERQRARERRDGGWRLIRQKYILSEASDASIAEWLEEREGTSLPDAYEQAVRAADYIGDQIYDNANEVAKREGLRRQLTTITKRLDQKRQRLADLRNDQAVLKKEWLALWQPCGLDPLAPDAMLAWLNDHEAVCTTIAQRDELFQKTSRVDERLTSFEQRLRTACGVTDVELSRLLESARQSVGEVKDQQRRAHELQSDIRRMDKQLAKYNADLQAIATHETTANAKWQAVLHRLKFPGEWSIGLAREVIDKLSATRVRLDGLPGEVARITAMQARIDEFEQRVHLLCNAIGPELAHDPPDIAIKKLDEQVERAIEAQRKYDAYSDKLKDAQAQLAILNDRHGQLTSEQTRLFALAESTSDAEFLGVVSRAEKIAQLDSEIHQFTRDIDLIRAGDDREEFDNCLSTSELVVLQGQERDLKGELNAAETARTTADGDEALARDALIRLDGSSEVGILSEEVSRRRSALVAEVDRYMPLIYARHLLNAAVSRFEKDHQPEMIATVSHLIGQMTDGKYTEFDRTGGGSQNVLIRRADGVERTPDQLSTGTREQLYLAIRIAYVLHYCKQNQPLPIIIDDVLANFDDQRACHTLRVLAEVSQTAQVLFFTCHAHMLELARKSIPELVAVTLPEV